MAHSAHIWKGRVIQATLVVCVCVFSWRHMDL